MSPELTALIEQAKAHVMTPEERKAQRLSFVYGMMPFDSPLSRDEVKNLLEDQGLM